LITQYPDDKVKRASLSLWLCNIAVKSRHCPTNSTDNPGLSPSILTQRDGYGHYLFTCGKLLAHWTKSNREQKTTHACSYVPSP